MIKEELSSLFKEAFSQHYDVQFEITVVESTKEHFGDYQCNDALRLAKELKLNPREVATKIAEGLAPRHEIFEKLEVAGPGFINIFLHPDYLSQAINQVRQEKKLGCRAPVKKERIVVDFSSPNIAKSMHVGHLRSSIIGDSIARLLEFLGHDVIRLNHVGDWGTQFGMLITYLKVFHPEVISSDQSADLDTLVEWYKAAKKKFDESESFKRQSQEEVVRLQAGDKETMHAWKNICEISRRGFSEIYDRLGITLTERGESFYNPMLPEVIADMEAKGLVREDGGAKCVFLEGFTNKEGDPLPLIIQKKDGGYNYATTDLAAFKFRVEKDHADRIIIVTDLGQSQHFKMVHKAAEMAGYIDPAKVRFSHVPFGLVLAPDGKKFKTREGETEKLKDLLDEAVTKAKSLLEERDVEDLERASKVLGFGAIKYADLSCNRIKDYTFSYERMLRFEGNTAAFILYAYVRIQSIKRKAGIDLSSMQGEKVTLTHPSEKTLALHLLRFPDSLQEMDMDLMPNRLTDYLYHLAEKFHAFFRDCQVVGVEEQNSRLLLSELTAQIIKQGLSILGIPTLDRM